MTSLKYNVCVVSSWPLTRTSRWQPRHLSEDNKNQRSLKAPFKSPIPLKWSPGGSLIPLRCLEHPEASMKALMALVWALPVCLKVQRIPEYLSVSQSISAYLGVSQSISEYLRGSQSCNIGILATRFQVKDQKKTRYCGLLFNRFYLLKFDCINLTIVTSSLRLNSLFYWE